MSPVLLNKHISVLWWCPRLAASSHYLTMICCIYQIAEDKPPPLFSQCETQAESALQLFRAHISTHLNLPVQVQRCWRCYPREKLRQGSPNFTFKQCRTIFFSSQPLISFSLNANLITVPVRFFLLWHQLSFCLSPSWIQCRKDCQETSTALRILALSIPSTHFCLNFR